MTVVITRYFAAHSDSDGAIANIYGPFADDDAARAWADANIAERTVWTTESVFAPF